MNLWEVNILNSAFTQIQKNASKLIDGRTPKETKEKLYWEIIRLTNLLSVDTKSLKYSENNETRSFL